MSDMDTVRQYEAYLRLQEDAGGMTDEEYLEHIDGILGTGSEQADAVDAQAGLQDPARQAELRDSIDAADDPSKAGENDGMASLLTVEQAAGMTPGVNMSPGTELESSDTGSDFGDNAAKDVETDGFYDGEHDDGGSVDGPDDAPLTPADKEFEALKKAHPEIDWEKYGPEDIAVRIVDARTGEVLSNTYLDGTPIDDPAHDEADAGGARMPQNASHVPDDPETSIQIDAADAGMLPGSDAVQDGPVDDTIETEVPQPAPGKTIAGGHVEVHEEAFEMSDFLDEAAVGTGLASSVQTAEYVPPVEIQAGTPYQPVQAQLVTPAPERSALAQRVIDIADRERSAAEIPEVSGPSV